MAAALGYNTTGFAFRVIIFFARNPHEELTSEDMAAKWPQLKQGGVAWRLRFYRKAGILNCVQSPKRLRSGGAELTWSAGPRLLEMI